jgi:hypothetical protein
MRFFSVFLAAICVAHINANAASAPAEHAAAADEHLEPYHKHHDTRHGHDHLYPDRGAVVRDLPHGAVVINYAGLSYRFSEAVWYEARGPAFIVVAPPIGLLVTALPAFVTPFESGGQTYLYANDVYYRPRPDLGGYEVVNDPVEGAASAESGGYVGGAAPSPSSLASAARAAAAQPAVAAPGPEDADADPPVVSAAHIVAAVPAPAVTAVSASVPTASVPTATPATAVTAIPTAVTTRVASAVPPVAAVPVTTVGEAALPSSGAPVAPVLTGTAVPAMTSVASSATPMPSTAQRLNRVIAYPKNGQTLDQQARDHYECYQFAVAQSGFDPMRSSVGSPVLQIAERQSDYDRAQSACFEGRGYTIR